MTVVVEDVASGDDANATAAARAGSGNARLAANITLSKRRDVSWAFKWFFMLVS
jgi:hypothetical protein